MLQEVCLGYPVHEQEYGSAFSSLVPTYATNHLKMENHVPLE